MTCTPKGKDSTEICLAASTVLIHTVSFVAKEMQIWLSGSRYQAPLLRLFYWEATLLIVIEFCTQRGVSTSHISSSGLPNQKSKPRGVIFFYAGSQPTVSLYQAFLGFLSSLQLDFPRGFCTGSWLCFLFCCFRFLSAEFISNHGSPTMTQINSKICDLLSLAQGLT